jgi:hypothetical protein
MNTTSLLDDGDIASLGLTPPAAWQVVERRRVGPFLTRVRFLLPDDRMLEWTARGHRKGFGLREVGRRHAGWRSGSWLFRPRRSNWWIGALFMVGSACFAIGTVPLYADAVGERIDAITFFVGSVFFTSAGFLQFRQAANAPVSVGDRWMTLPSPLRVFSANARRIGWWATAVQLAGTIAFNVTTLSAISEDLELRGERALVWFPNWFGSLCFLVASALACMEVCDRKWWRPAGTDWWITMLNMLGSIFFGLSAFGAFVLSSGEDRNVWLVATGTFLGALCFFVGAALLLPEAADDAGTQPAT